MQSLLVDNFDDFKCKDTVVNVDSAAYFNDFGNVLVVNVPRTRLAIFHGIDVLRGLTCSCCR